MITGTQPKRFLGVNSFPRDFRLGNSFSFRNNILQTEDRIKRRAGYVGHRSETKISYTIKLWPEKPTGMKSPENITCTTEDNTEKDLREMRWKALAGREVFSVSTLQPRV
jgi:hypothetical protein